LKSLIIALVLSITSSNNTSDIFVGSKQTKETILVDGRQRKYIQFLPQGWDTATNMPVLFVLHGGKGSPKGMLKYVDYRELATSKKFLLVYPKGIEKNWNDGRPTNANLLGVDDVNFFRKLIDKLASNYSINEEAVFVTGISNGAFMASRLGCELGDKIKAFASVSGTIEATTIASNCSPNVAVSALYIHGTLDKFVPFKGGKMSRGAGGFILSHWDAIAKFNENNDSSETPSIINLPDIADDGTTIIETKYSNSTHGSEVISYVIENGGHTWPQGRDGFDFFLGITSEDMNAKQVIWDFFERHIQN